MKAPHSWVPHLSDRPIGQVEEKISDLKKDYETITTAVPEFAQYSLLEFSQVRMLVSSRIFGITINGKVTDGLVPLAGTNIVYP